MAMKLPNRKNAVIRREKLTGYLLSLTHEEGKSKAKFFRGIGFNETNIEKLEQTLLTIGKSNDVRKVDDAKSEYVIKYIIDGVIESPNGKQYKTRTVWRIKIGNKIPGFVTAYPYV